MPGEDRQTDDETMTALTSRLAGPYAAPIEAAMASKALHRETQMPGGTKEDLNRPVSGAQGRPQRKAGRYQAESRTRSKRYDVSHLTRTRSAAAGESELNLQWKC